MYDAVAPSPTDALPDRLTVVTSIVSLMAVTAAAPLTARFSKLPPVAVVIVAETLPASTCTSSLGAATLTLPELAPAAMVIVVPLLSVTVTGVCATLVSAAV